MAAGVDVRVVFVEPLYELNIGYLARVMKNFGYRELYLVKPHAPIGRGARMMAANAQDVLDSVIIVDDLEEALKGVDLVVGTTGKPGRDWNVERAAITLTEFCGLLERAEVSGKLALLLGREDHGLTNEILARCDIVVTIEANPEYPILNVSHAAAILLYEIFKTTRRTRRFIELASSEEKERLIAYFERLMDAVNYPEVKRKAALIAFRRLLGRALVSSREVHALYGVFRRAVLMLERRATGGAEEEKGLIDASR